jgi:hypothetical protein
VYNSSHNCVGNNIIVVLLVLVKICHIMTQKCFILFTTYTNLLSIICPLEVRCSWSYGSWIYNYLCNRCNLSCEFEPHSWRGVLDTTLCDKDCQWLVTCGFLWVLRLPPPICLYNMFTHCISSVLGLIYGV